MLLYTYSEIEREFKKRKINRAITPLVNIEELIENPLRYKENNFTNRVKL